MKYIIQWNSGYGNMYETIEVETEEEAKGYAYEQWRQDAEDNADYGIQCEWSEEAAEDYGVE